MPKGLDRVRRPDPLIFVIGALLCAAVLVVYLQHRALRDLDRQTAVILQKVAEQTVSAAALEIRRTFDGPVFDTLAAVNHPHLAAGRLDLVAAEYRRGLDIYPQVERFFVWTAETEAVAPGEVLFYDASRDAGAFLAAGPRPALDVFRRDMQMGRLILRRAREHVGSQRIYLAVSERLNDVPYDIFIRLFYTDAARNQFFAVLGFAVSLERARGDLFAAMHRQRLAELLEPADGSPSFDMRVFDENGGLVFGPGTTIPPVSARATFALQFYPVDDIGSRMAALAPSREWALVVSPRAQKAAIIVAATRTQGYWLSGLSVLFMLVALVIAVRSQRRAAQVARMQADFVAHVSHQLKTPVSLLSAAAESVALERVRTPEALTQYVEIVRSQTSRLSALVERILEFSRIDGRRGYEIETIALGTLVRETVEAFARAVETDGYRISVVESGPAPVVAADPAALEQALVNLLDNAIRYSGESRAVTVRVGVSGSDATVEVADQGVGIDPAERARIFERFYRGRSGALNRQGFGLGLPIAGEIVAAHRGSIDVESVPGRGSVFRIRLPLRHREATGAESVGRWRGQEAK